MVAETQTAEFQIEGFEALCSPAFACLREILMAQVLELCEEGRDILVPYMMNDALEYYLRLTEARSVGTYDPEKTLVLAQLVKEEERYRLILGQEDGSRCTVSFQTVEESATCYQYHAIGHFWVAGQEKWRRLVYIIGTIYDKYEYFGDRFCNPLELRLMHLIRFAPFRTWTPIHESLKSRYPSSGEGRKAMEWLAEEAGDRAYMRWLKIYRVFPFRPVEGHLARLLLAPARKKLYDLLVDKVREASLEYRVRDYGKEGNARAEAMRRSLTEALLNHGFKGNYPMFRKDELTVEAAEEHPFTVLESEEYAFRIQLLVTASHEDERIVRLGFSEAAKEPYVVHYDTLSSTCDLLEDKHEL